MADRPNYERLYRLVLVAMLLASPTVTTVAILKWFHYDLATLVPGNPTDEMDYFVQVRGFATYGLNVGYFGIEEHPAPAKFSHFGVHGPVFPVLYGALARIFPLWPGLATYLNIGFFTLALALYVWLTRPAPKTLALLIAFALTFWPFYLYVSSWMQDVFHYALAVVFAGLFTAILRQSFPRYRSALFVVTFLAICFASLIRVSWVSLFFPLFLLGPKKLTLRKASLRFGVACAATVACMKAFQLLCAPFTVTPYPSFEWTMNTEEFFMNKLFTGEVGPERLARHIYTQASAFGTYFWNGGPCFDLGSNIMSETVLVIVAVAWIGVLLWKERSRAKLPADDGAWRWLAFIGYNQGAILLATVAVYFVANFDGPRIFAVHLLISLLVACNAPLASLRAFLPAAIVINVLMTGGCLSTIEYTNGLRFDRHKSLGPFMLAEHLEEYRQRFAACIQYDPRGDPWANTLLTDRMPYLLSALPPGIGIEYYFSPGILAHPVRSRYIIAVPEEIRPIRHRLKPLTPLGKVPGEFYDYPGRSTPNLYLNLQPARSDWPGGRER